MSQHKATSIAGKGEPAKVVEVSTVSPSEGEVLVKVRAAAINPIDYYMRDTGFYVQSWPITVGSDVAGEVVETGSGVSNFKKGDRVLVATSFLGTGKSSQAGFQELVIAPSINVAKIPDDMKFSDAVVVPLSAATASAGLYEKAHLALDLPSLSPKPNGKKILVWGASTSVAASAIQLAVASGYEVIATASKKNFDHAKKLGASKVFDYTSPSIVGDLTEELQNGTFVGAYDAVTKEDSQLAIATVIAQLGGGKIASVLPPPESIPATVESKMVMATNIFSKSPEVGKAVFGEYLPKALASGQYVPQPKAEIFGNGLEVVNSAMDKHQAGVSATKIVVTL